MGDRRSKSARKQQKRRENGKRRRISDSRGKKRCQARDRVVAAPTDDARRPDRRKDGRLILAFKAVDSRDKMHPHGGFKTLLAGRALFMDDQPHESVGDAEVGIAWPFPSSRLRVVTVDPEELNSRPLSLLDEFILYHTMGEA